MNGVNIHSFPSCDYKSGQRQDDVYLQGRYALPGTYMALQGRNFKVEVCFCLMAL